MDAPGHPAVAAPPASVTADKSCIYCSYNLKGLPITGPCPECGRPVADSLRGFLLRHAAPAYRALLIRALGLVTNGILLFILLGIAMIFAGAVLPAHLGGELAPLVLLIPQGMILWGYWLYSTPDPGFAGEGEPIRSRKVLRVVTSVLIVAMLLAILLGFVSEATTGGVSVITDILSSVAALVSGLAWLVHFFATMLYTRWIAKRIPSDKWVRRTRVYLWLLPLLLVGPLALQVLYTAIVLASVPSTPPSGQVTPAPAAAQGMIMLAGMGLGLFVGCFWFIAALVSLILYWNMLHYIRAAIRRVDRAAS